MRNFYQYQLIILFLSLTTTLYTQAQQSVSIGDTQIKSNAVLYLKGSGSQGLIIPVVSSTGSFGESGMIVFNSTDKKLYYHNGTAWVEAGGGGASTEVDGIIGNEVTQVITDRGLNIKGTGTAADPKTVGIIDGTVDGQILKWNNTTKKWELSTITAGGTVTSAALTLPSIFTVTGSPITTTGTLAATLNSQAAATVLAAPTAAAGVPTFRALATTDIPALDAAKITTGTFAPARLTGAGATAKGILTSNNNTVSWVAGAAPDQLLGTDGTGAFQFVNKSNFGFNSVNVIPKGSASGLIASSIFDNGNVGIGTTSPTYRLDVSKTLSSASDTQIRTYNPTGSKSGIKFETVSGWAVQLQTDDAAGDWLQLTNNSGTTIAHRWIFDSYFPGNGTGYLQGIGGNLALMGGNVGIGTTTPTQRLEVNGAIKSGNGYYYFSDATFIAHLPGSYTILNDHWIPNNNNVYDLGTSTFRWRNAFLNNNPNVSSDSRLKQNISGLKYGLSEVMKLRPVSYKLINDTEQKIKLGFIAQEVKEVIAEIVTEDNTREKYLGMSYSELIPVLTNAIQEQQKIIETLKAKINTLQNSNDVDITQVKLELAEIKKMLGAEAKLNSK